MRQIEDMIGLEVRGMTAPDVMQNEVPKLSPAEKQSALESMQEISRLIEEMITQGATEEEIEAFLAELGISLEELEFAEKLFDDSAQMQKLGL